MNNRISQKISVYKKTISLIVFFICSVLFSSVLHAEITFNDSDPAYIVLSDSDGWKAAFLKSNGALVYIKDQSSGEVICNGSKDGNLWSVHIFDQSPPYIKSSQYSADGGNRFNYEWNPGESILTFEYLPDSRVTNSLKAIVTILARESKGFDMKISIENNLGVRIENINFPAELKFTSKKIQHAFLPILPGVKLKSGYFIEKRTYSAKYPGLPGVFSDFISFSLSGGYLSIFSLQNESPLKPVIFQIKNSDGFTHYNHAFGAAAPDGSVFTTPLVCFLIGENHVEAIASFRADSDITEFENLSEKLGTLYSSIVKSPVVKLGAVKIGLPFSQYASDIFPDIPAPATLHFVSFQKGGFDENNPDNFPPDKRWGTMADYVSMVTKAKEAGYLVMPYSNPTWWDDQSDTVQNLPSGVSLEDITVLGRYQSPVYEKYGSKGGYVINPFAEYTRQRLDEFITDFMDDARSDMLFEDQIGARRWLFDFNPVSPSEIHYTEGWLEHTRTYKDRLLSTELGYDRLAETNFAFFGSLLHRELTGEADSWWGNGNWEIFPIAGFMLRDKVLLFQHDLADETMIHDKYNFAWNISYGYLLNYQIVPGETQEEGWINAISMFQREVLSRYAAELINEYAVISLNITKTVFETYTVYTNWNEYVSAEIEGQTVAPMGVLIQDESGQLTAGVFTEYNDYTLSSGDHFIIEERTEDIITVRHPLGQDTLITIKINEGWGGRIVIEVYEIGEDGLAAPVIVEQEGDYIIFTIRTKREEKRIDRYLIFPSAVEH